MVNDYILIGIGFAMGIMTAEENVFGDPFVFVAVVALWPIILVGAIFEMWKGR